MIDLLVAFQDTLKVLLGAFIGILGGIVAWHLQNTTHKKRQREELLLRAIQLTLHSLTYTRCISYAKFTDIKTLIQLPENPVDQLLAVALIHFPSAFPLSQELHHQQQELYAFPYDDPKAPEAIKKIGEQMANTVTKLVKKFNQIGIEENIGVNLTRKKQNATTSEIATTNAGTISAGDRKTV